MKPYRLLLLSIASPLLLPPAFGAGTAPLTVDQCVRLAAENHPSLAGARAAIEAADRALDETRAMTQVQVDAVAGYHRWQRRAFLPAGIIPPGASMPEEIGPLDDWNAGLVARATLFDFGERRAGVDAASARRDAVEADAGAVASDLRWLVRRAFFALAAARELQDVAARSLERAEAGFRLAEARHTAGAVPKADTLRAHAEVAAAQLDVITAASGVRIASGRLNAAIGRPADSLIEIEAGFDPPTGPVDAAAVAADALEGRPELESVRRQRAAVEAAVRGAQASRTPHVRADGSFGFRDTGFLPETHEWQAGLSVDVPVFDAGARSNRVARTRAELAQVEARLAALELQVREEVWSAAAELERARAALSANEALVRQREEALRVVRARYEAGGAIATDLLDTQAALAAAEAAWARSRWELMMASAALDRAAGRGGALKPGISPDA